MSLLRYRSHLCIMVRCSSTPFMQVRTIRGRYKKEHSEYDEFLRDAQEMFPEGDPLGYHAIEDLEKMTDWVDVDTGTLQQDLMKEESRSKSAIKKQIIKRKFFKPPQEANLLTWAAKEQIRFLHAEYPEEWTVEKLSNSFPISQEGVRKMLRSTFVPENQAVIDKHDRRVEKTWKQLVEGNQDSGGPIATKYQALVTSGRLEVLENATGIKSLPMPETKCITEGVPKQVKKGVFSGIYQAYAESKTGKAQAENMVKLIDGGEKLNEIESVKLLEKIVSSNKHGNIKKKALNFVDFKSNAGRNDQFKNYGEPLGSTPMRNSRHFTNMDSLHEMGSMYDLYNKPEDEHAGLKDVTAVTDNMKGRRLRRRRKYTTSTSLTHDDNVKDLSRDNTQENDILEMQGTGRIENIDNRSNRSNEFVMEEYDIEDDSVSERLKYQRKLSIPAKSIHIPKEKQKKGAIYQRGDCFFDENGEFLYRLP